ncbi:MAG: hypothetical protein CVT80_10830 [Alphaproteobacteria bacterium HGW-Alphaproteobacteria-2]|nr:MAG: hypothetical protein CVT80_10830 [Alphaproteobacteria bacterium HGW-Alphaproteobacteria-2]
MHRSLALLAILFSAPALAGPMSPEALEALPRADAVLLGEVHDNPAHHANQARAAAALQPRAIVFEMLTPDQAARVTAENRDDAAALAEAVGWEGSGWPDFALYHPIITAAPGAAILGGALPRETVRRAFETDAATVFGAEAARYGLDRALPEAEQAAREAEQMAAHCDALPEAMLPGMVAAQRLRDRLNERNPAWPSGPAAADRPAQRLTRKRSRPSFAVTWQGSSASQGMPSACAAAAGAVSIQAVATPAGAKRQSGWPEVRSGPASEMWRATISSTPSSEKCSTGAPGSPGKPPPPCAR